MEHSYYLIDDETDPYQEHLDYEMGAEDGEYRAMREEAMHEAAMEAVWAAQEAAERAAQEAAEDEETPDCVMAARVAAKKWAAEYPRFQDSCNGGPTYVYDNLPF